MSTFQDIIDRWPESKTKPAHKARRPADRRYKSRLQSFADDMNIPYPRAQLMRHRNSVPPKYWPKLVDAARVRGVRGVSYVVLSKAYEARWKNGNGQAASR